MKHFPRVKETTDQQLDDFLQNERTHLPCYLLGMENPLKSFKLDITELQVKELQKADVKASCFHKEFNNEKQLMEGQFSIVYGTLEADTAKTTN